MSRATLPESRRRLLKDKHAEYIHGYGQVCCSPTFPVDGAQMSVDQHMSSVSLQTKTSFEFYATEHFRMSGVYWGLTAMHLLGKQRMMDTALIVDWVLSCQHSNGGFGGSERHDPHLLYTLSAIQILALCKALDRINKEHVVRCEPPELYCTPGVTGFYSLTRSSLLYWIVCVPLQV